LQSKRHLLLQDITKSYVIYYYKNITKYYKILQKVVTLMNRWQTTKVISQMLPLKVAQSGPWWW